MDVPLWKLVRSDGILLHLGATDKRLVVVVVLRLIVVLQLVIVLQLVWVFLFLVCRVVRD